MQINTKFEYNQRVYIESRGGVVSGVVKSVNCKNDRFGLSVSYDVWIDRDEKITYEYWMSLSEKYFFGTVEEVEKQIEKNKELYFGKGKG